MLHITKTKTRRTTLAQLIGAVRSLPRSELSEFLDALAGLQCVTDAGWRVRERRTSCERYGVRNAEIRQRQKRGETYGQLALAYGLSRGRIWKIVNVPRAESVDIETG